MRGSEGRRSVDPVLLGLEDGRPQGSFRVWHEEEDEPTSEEGPHAPPAQELS